MRPRSKTKSKTRLPKHILSHLKEAYRAARLERCGVNESAQKEMKLYLDTWVVGPLAEVLGWAEKDK